MAGMEGGEGMTRRKWHPRDGLTITPAQIRIGLKARSAKLADAVSAKPRCQKHRDEPLTPDGNCWLCFVEKRYPNPGEPIEEAEKAHFQRCAPAELTITETQTGRVHRFRVGGRRS